jgi:hypothetical protein
MTARTARGPWPERLAIFLASLVIILVELALMRELALRFWEHLAWLAISIGLLGFGAGGTVLVLVHRFFEVRRETLQCIALIGLGLSLPASVWLADSVEVNLIQMVWQPSMVLGVGRLEMILAVPFLFGGMFIGLALEDIPERTGGHYAASFLGSGAGGLVTPPLLYIASPRLLIVLGGGIAMFLAPLFIRRRALAAGWLVSTLLLIVMAPLVPPQPKISAEKDIVQLSAQPDHRTIASRLSPQGRLDVMQAAGYHLGPGLALNYLENIPPQKFILVDGGIVGSLYEIASFDDFEFMDYTTLALPYAMGRIKEVLIGDETGSDQAGLALFHGVERISVLTRNSRFIDLLENESSLSGDKVYNSGRVSLGVGTLREHLLKSNAHFPLIVLPTVGDDPGGLASTEPDSRITIDTMRLGFSRLDRGGLLAVSSGIQLPPRESLRLLNMMIEVLLESGRTPAHHLAMIRNWATVTVVASESPLTAAALTRIRDFCRKRGYDLIWLPDLEQEETNRFHRLEQDDYVLSAMSLLGAGRNRFVEDSFYNLSIPDDNKPFFGHFSRRLPFFSQTGYPGRSGLAYVEIGPLLLAAALGQAIVLAGIFIVLPLLPAIRMPGKRFEQLNVVGFFSTLGFGFMLFEMGLLQRLTVYLAHPVWASATVLSGFLLFGGVGSSLSTLYRKRLAVTHLAVITGVVAAGCMLVWFTELLLNLTGGLELPFRIAVTYLLLAPPAVLMGMVFPLGLRRLGQAQPRWIPWAWSANGFSSVLATLCAPVLAMQWGFNLVVWSAIGCYCLAALFSLKLPEDL